MRLGVSGELLEVLDRAVRVHGEIARVVDEIAQEVVALPVKVGLALDRYREHVRRVDHADRVAVRRRARQLREADGAAGARLVQDDDPRVVAQVLLDERRDGASGQVGASAGGVGTIMVIGLSGYAACACSSPRSNRQMHARLRAMLH